MLKVKMTTRNSLLLLLFIAFSACRNETKYHSFQYIKNKDWNKSDTLIYNIPVTASKGIYRLQIEIRHTDNYKYKNLWLEMSNNLKDSTRFVKDSIQLKLADKSGRWYGDGIGGLYQFDTLFTKRIIVSQTANNHSLRITHIMRDNSLPGIRDIGIRLDKIAD